MRRCQTCRGLIGLALSLAGIAACGPPHAALTPAVFARASPVTTTPTPQAAGVLITVNSTGDVDNQVGAPNCDVDLATPGDQCTFRAAIQAANLSPGDDGIEFAIPLTDSSCDAAGRCVINLTNTPDVNVANTVRVSEAPRQPFNVVEQRNFGAGVTVVGGELFTVPEGKQLVVTYASAALALPADQKVTFSVSVLSSTNIFRAIHRLAPVLSGPIVGGGNPAFVASGPVNFYLSAGEVLDCRFVRDGDAGSAFGLCSVSGYLVGAPWLWSVAGRFASVLVARPLLSSSSTPDLSEPSPARGRIRRARDGKSAGGKNGRLVASNLFAATH